MLTILFIIITSVDDLLDAPPVADDVITSLPLWRPVRGRHRRGPHVRGPPPRRPDGLARPTSHPTAHVAPQSITHERKDHQNDAGAHENPPRPRRPRPATPIPHLLYCTVTPPKKFFVCSVRDEITSFPSLLIRSTVQYTRLRPLAVYGQFALTK